jgi:hypothetical protein
MLRRGALALVLTASCLACDAPPPPERPTRFKGTDGATYYLLDRGQYKAFYDAYGKLQRLEYDSNNDGKTDVWAHHNGAKVPSLLEIDENFDGKIDRWEEYNQSGLLIKVGTSRRGKGPDQWVFPGPDGSPLRREFDEDGDSRVDRIELLRQGRIVETRIDTDRDGRIDRWQFWENGRTTSEELDTDGDGRPDRRIRYGPGGAVTAVEPIG